MRCDGKTCLWFRRVHQNGQRLSSLNAGYDQFIVQLILNKKKKQRIFHLMVSLSLNDTKRIQREEEEEYIKKEPKTK